MKRIWIITLFVFFLSSCSQTVETDDYSIIKNAKQSLEVSETITEENSSLTDNICIVEIETNESTCVSITWTSSKPGTLDEYDIIHQEEDIETILTAILEYDGITLTKNFTVTITGTGEIQTYLHEQADLFGFTSFILEESIMLPEEINDVSITWQTDNNSCLGTNGAVTRLETDCAVTLTATYQYLGYETTRTYDFTVLALDQIDPTYTGYYLGADGLVGELLKSFLHDLIDDHTVLSYSQLWDALSQTDEDPNNPNNVILLYSGRSQSKSTHGGDPNDWNREHVWPRSHGDLEGSGGPAYTDLHHIRPTDVTVNGSRGNLDFDEGGSLVSETTGSYKDGDSFEPRDEVKGDVARMIFYMAVRYEGDLSNELDLELNNLVNNSGPYMGKLSVLIQWHLEDLPDEFEMNRNEVIYSIQGNRNPFIDHPEFVEMIWN